MSQRPFHRGEVYWINLGGGRGGEIAKTQPAVIVNNDIANRRLNRVQIVPLTTNVQRDYGSEALVRLNGVSNKAMADQILTTAKERVGDFVGTLSDSDMLGVDRALMLQLGLRR